MLGVEEQEMLVAGERGAAVEQERPEETCL